MGVSSKSKVLFDIGVYKSWKMEMSQATLQI